METFSRLASSQLTSAGSLEHYTSKTGGKPQAPSPAPSLHGEFLSQVVRAAIAAPGTLESHIKHLNLQNQVDEAFGVDKLRQDNEVLQQQLALSREQAIALEEEVQRLGMLLQQTEESDVARVLRDLKLRQMGALNEDQRKTRKRPELPRKEALASPPPQRRAVEVGGRPQAPLPSGSNQDAVENEWEEYNHAQEKLSFLQQEFNTTFTALSSQKMLVSARHERMMNLLSQRAVDVTSAAPGNISTPIRDESAGEGSARDNSFRGESDSSSRESTPRRIDVANHDVFQDARGRDGSLDEAVQREEIAGLDESTSGEPRAFQEMLESPPESPFTTVQQSPDQLKSIPSILLRSDSPRELSSGQTPTKVDTQCSCPASMGSKGPKLPYASTPWTWQKDGALSEAAQDLIKSRSVQMETERQRLWQAAGIDPEALKQRLKELHDREGALAEKAMHLEARENLVAEREQLSDVALSRSIALDRREADLKDRELRLVHNATTHAAREEEVKVLKKRIADLERLVGTISSPSPQLTDNS